MIDTMTLIESCALGNLSKVINLVEAGVDVNFVDYDLRSPLHLAASEGHLSVVKFLMAHGADVGVKDRWNNTPLTEAIRFDHNEVGKYLLDNGADIESQLDEICSIFFMAVYKGDIEKVHSLLKSGLDSKKVFDFDQRTPLHIASSAGHFEIVKLLIKYGADVNAVDRFGNTPLVDAQRGSSGIKTKIASYLKYKGATIVADIWDTRNNPEFVSHVQKCVTSLSERDNFEYAEIWIPNEKETYITSSEFFYASNSLGKRCSDYHMNFSENVRITKGSGTVGKIWEEGKALIIDQFKHNTDQSNALKTLGLKSGIGVPIIYDDRVLLVLMFYSYRERKYNKKFLGEFKSYITGLIGTGILNFEHFDKSKLFNDFPSHDAKQMRGVFEYIVNQGVFNPQAAYKEVVWFYGLGLSKLYFDKYETDTIGKHVQALGAAKKLAQAAETPDNVWVSLDDQEEHKFFVCPTNFKSSMQLEEKIERIIGKVSSRNSISVTYFCSSNPVTPNGESISIYIVESTPFIRFDVPENETNIWKIASNQFLKDKAMEVRERYQDIINNSVAQLSPFVKIYPPSSEDGLIPVVISIREGRTKPHMRKFTELLRYHQLRVQRKFVETFSIGMVVFTFYIHPETDVQPFLNDISLLLIVPSSSLTPTFLAGGLSCEEYMYASSISKFIYYFMDKRNEEVKAIEKALSYNRKNGARFQQMRERLNIEAISAVRISEVIQMYPKIMKMIFADFKESLKNGPGNYNKNLSIHIDQNVFNLLDSRILKEFLNFNCHILKSNFYKIKKGSLAFSLDPNCISECDFDKIPFGLFYIFGSTFQGFHIRFRDIARGGIRMILSKNNYIYNKNMQGVFKENYGLSLTQNNKNKDIPEFGSKGTVLINPDQYELGDHSFKLYIAGILDLIVPNEEIIDNYKKPELLFLGPDENTAHLMNWASQYSKKRGYTYWKSFTTGKPASVGGIPHDTYGMTTASVHEYVLGSLEKLGLDESTVTKCQIGGPDGDLGSNEILVSKDKTTSIVDGSGVIHDPNGINREELTRLAHERLPISFFDKSLLSENGFLILVSDTDISLPNGEFIRSGLHFRNDFHLHPLSAADLFVPCGGRPNSINFSNVGSIANGKWKIIVEGANLFITQDARLILEESGVVLYKDASSNKGGVTSSSLEVLASLAMTDEEHDLHMCVKDGLVPEFYQSYVNDILVIIKRNARDEFECIWRECEATGTPKSVLTDLVSEKINMLNDTITNSEFVENEVLRKLVLEISIPNTLLKLVPAEEILKRAPENYVKALFASTLASRYVYTNGLESNEFSFLEFLQKQFGVKISM